MTKSGLKLIQEHIDMQQYDHAWDKCQELIEALEYVPFEGLFIDIRYKDKNVQFGNKKAYSIETINLTYFPTVAGQETERMIRDIFGQGK